MIGEHPKSGSANEIERLRSARLQPRLERVVRLLIAEGFTRAEAISFIGGLAYDRPGGQDHYASPAVARRAVEGVLSGYRNARMFGLDSIVAALHDIADLFTDKANT